MDIAINEQSFQRPDTASDVELLRNLTRTLKALKDRVAACDRAKVRVRVTEAWLKPRRLPGGTEIGTARRALDDVERTLCDCFFTDYPSFPIEDPPVFHHGDAPAHGLGYAHASRLVAASLATAGYAVDQLWVESRRAEIPSGHVPNAWRPELHRRHVDAMAPHVQVLPRHVDPGHHDPDTSQYDPSKSVIPRGAKGLFQHAQHDDQRTWWTKCECNAFHRFQGGDPVHWNGTTSPRARQQISERDVPTAIRKHWQYRPGVPDCGCR